MPEIRQHRLLAGNRAHGRALNWLRKALSKDDSKPRLQIFHRVREWIIAADGYRAHVLPVREIGHGAETVLGESEQWKIEKQPDGDFLVVATPCDLKKVSFGSIIGATQKTFRKEHHCIMVSAGYLREALEYVTRGRYSEVVVLHFGGRRDPLVVSYCEKDGSKPFAILMPAAATGFGGDVLELHLPDLSEEETPDDSTVA